MTKRLISLINTHLLSEFDFQAVEPVKRESMLMDMVENVQDRIILRGIQEMNKDRKEQFIHELQNSTDETAIEGAIKKNIPNIDEVMQEEVLLYKNEMLAIMG